MAIIGSAHVEVHAITDKVKGEVKDGLEKGIKGTGTDAGKQFTDEFSNETGRGIAGVANDLGNRIADSLGGSGSAAGKSFADKFRTATNAISGQRIKAGDLDTSLIEKRIDALRVKLEELRKIKANPTVDIEIGVVESKIARVEARLEELRKKKTSPRVDAEIKIAEAQLAKLRGNLDELQRNPRSAKIDADIALAEAQMAKLEQSLHKLTGPKHQIKFEARQRDLTQSLISVSALSRAIMTLTIPVVSLGATPAIASLGLSAVQAAGSLYLLPAAAGAAALGIGTLAVGLTSMADALGPTGTEGQIKKVNEALANLSPQARATALAIRGLGDEWKNLRIEVQDALFEDTADDVNALAGIYMPMLRDSMKQVADGFNDGATSISAFLQSSYGIQTVRDGMANVTTATTTLTGVMEPLSRAFFDIFYIGSGYLDRYAQGLVSMTEHFATYIEQARASGELNRLIEQGIAVLTDLVEIAANVGDILGAIFRAGEEAGGNFLTTLNTVTGELAVFLNSAEGQDALVALFKAIHDTVKAALPGIIALGQALGQSIIVLGPVLPQIGEAFSALAIAAAPFIVQMAKLLSVILPPLISLIQGMAPVLGPVIAAFLAFYGVATVIGGVVGVISKMASAMQLVAIAQKVWTAAVWLFNAAMAANPITLIIIGIAALVAAIVLAWQHSETFRNIVTGAFDAVVGAVMAVVDWFKGLPEAIGNAISAAGEWLAGLGTSAMNAASAVGTWIGELPGKIGSWLAGLGTAVADAAVAAWNWLVTAAQDAGSALLSWLVNLPNNIAYALGHLAGTLVRLAIDGWNGFTEGVISAFVNTVAWFQALPGRIASFLVNLGKTIRDNAISSWEEFTSGLASAFVNTVAWFQALPNRIASFLINLGTTIRDNAVSSWNSFTDGLITAFANTVAWLRGVPGAVGNYLLGLAVTLLASATKAWDGFTAGLASAFVNTIAWFQALPGRIGAFFVNAGTWLLDVGGDILDGLINGLVSGAKAVIDWFGGLVDSFLQGFKDGLGIASPSTVFAQFGTWILEGLINGLTAMVDAVLGFVTGFVDSFIAGWNALLSFFGTVWNGILNVATTVWNAIVAFFTTGFTTFQTYFNEIWTTIQQLFEFVWNAILNVAMTIWNAIASFFQNALTGYQILFTTIWNAVSAVFSAVWNGIKTVATTVWNAISTFFTTAFTTFQNYFNLIWTTIQQLFEFVWNAIRTSATNIWNAISSFFTNAFNTFRIYFNEIWTTIQQLFEFVWNAIKTAAETIWNAISAFFTTAFNAYRALFETVWNTIKTVFETVWNAIKTAATTIWNAIVSFFTGAWDTFKRLWDTFWNGISTSFSNLWEGIKNVAKSAWEGIQSMFKGGINLVIDAVNWPIEKINGALGISIPTIPRLATGGTIDREGITGRVNGPGSTTNDAVITRLSREEHVWSAAEVRAAGGHDAVRRMRAQVMAGMSPVAAPNSLSSRMAATGVDPDRLGGSSVRQGLRRRQLMDRYPNLDDLGRPGLAYGGVRPHVAAAGDAVVRALGPMPGGIGGVGSRPNASDHPAGLALDFMTLGNVGLGDRVAGMLQAQAQQFAVKYLIWQQAINNGSGWEAMEDRGSATANHMDHVHASFHADPGAGSAFTGGGLFDPGALFDSVAAALGLPEVSRQLTRDIMPNSPDWLEPMGVSFHDKAWSGFRATAIKLLEMVSTLGGLLGGGPGAAGPVADQVRAVAAQYGWDTGAEWAALSELIQRESSWNPAAANPTSSARGLFQKMTSLHGPVEPTAAGQAQWGLNYIKGKYGSPSAALAHHDRVGSYDRGGWLQPGITQAINGTGKPEAIIADPMTTFERSFKHIFKWFAPLCRDALRDGIDKSMMSAAAELLGAMRSGKTIHEDLSFRGMSANLANLNDRLAEAFTGTSMEDLEAFLRKLLRNGGRLPEAPVPPLPPQPPLPPIELPPVAVPELPTGELGATFQDVLKTFAPELSLALKAGAGDQALFLSKEILANNERLAAMSQAMGTDIKPILNNLVKSLAPPPPPPIPPIVIPQPSWLERQIEMLRAFAEANKHRVNPISSRLDQLPHHLEKAVKEAFPELKHALDTGRTDANKVLSQYSTELLAWLQTRRAEEQTQILWALDGQKRNLDDVLKIAQDSVKPEPAPTPPPTVTIADGAFQVTIAGNADSVTVDQLRETLTAWGDEIIHQYEGRT